VTEALGVMLNETHDPEYMMALGGMYYERKEFDLARKYYEMAAQCGYEQAHACLGYVFYYGRTGEPDYEKAFEHFTKSADQGNIQSAYKIADMYKNGYYVEKDYDKYVSIIEDLWNRLVEGGNIDNFLAPVPELATRLARIRTQQGDPDGEALQLYYKARSVLEERIEHSRFFGDFSIMKGIINDLYQLTPLDPERIEFYDLYEVLKRPCKVRFKYFGRPWELTCTIEDGASIIEFGGKYFRDIDDFMQHASASEGSLLCENLYRLTDFAAEWT